MPRIVPSVDQAANRLIHRLLAALLDQAPRAVLVCLKIVDGDDRQWEMDRSYFRVTNRVKRSRRQDALTRWMPSVPNWGPMLPGLRDGLCPLLRIADLRSGPLPERLPPTLASRALVCPVADSRATLLGAVIIVFDRRDSRPRGAVLRRIAVAGTRAGGQIGAVLDLSGRGRAPMRYPEAA
jgi:hypothetical protein